MFQTLFTWYALSVGGTLSDAIQHMLYIVFPLNVHRKIVVKEKKSMLYTWNSIALVFPLEFRDFCNNYSGKTKTA